MFNIFLLLSAILIVGIIALFIRYLKRSNQEENPRPSLSEIELPKLDPINNQEAMNDLKPNLRAQTAEEKFKDPSFDREKSIEFVLDELLKKEVKKTPTEQKKPGVTAIDLRNKVLSLKNIDFDWTVFRNLPLTNETAKSRLQQLIEAHKFQPKNVFLNVLERGCNIALRGDPKADIETAIIDAWNDFNRGA